MSELRTRDAVERFTTSRPVVWSQNAPCSLPPLAKMTIPVTKAKASVSTVLTRACYQGQLIVIKKGAHLTAVILGYEDFQRLADLEARYESALLAKSFKDDRFFTLDDVTTRVGL